MATDKIRNLRHKDNEYEIKNKIDNTPSFESDIPNSSIYNKINSLRSNIFNNKVCVELLIFKNNITGQSYQFFEYEISR